MDYFIQEEKYIEKYPNPITIDGTETILYQMKNCICKIINKDGINGTGFFCRIPYNNQLLPFLITNYHVLNENIYRNKEKIELTLNDGKKAIIINLDNSRIKFTDEELDITIVQLKPKQDKINYFLDIDDNINTNLENLYNNKSIYILHYPKGNIVNVSYGLSSKIIDYNLNHFCSTEEGSSGGPILSLDSFKVIGIHKGSPKNKILNFNIGTFIKSVIQKFNKKNNNTNYNYNINNEVYYQNSYNQEMNNMNNINYINYSNIDNQNSNYLIENNLINSNIKGINESIKNSQTKYQSIIKPTIFRNIIVRKPIERGPKNLVEGLNEEFGMYNNELLSSSVNKEINNGPIIRTPIIKNQRLGSIIDHNIKVLPMVYGGTRVSNESNIN